MRFRLRIRILDPPVTKSGSRRYKGLHIHVFEGQNTMIRSTFLTLLLLPLAASADNGDLGGDSRWFVQVNLVAMRSASDDGALYGWLKDEVIDDLEEEFGEGSVEDFDAATVFGAGDDGDGLGIVLDGQMNAAMRERLIKRLAAKPLLDLAGGDAFVVGADEKMAEEFDVKFDIEGLLLGFGQDSSAFVTTSRDLLEDFLAGDRFRAISASDLLVVRAEPMVSGSVDTESIGKGYGNWNSKVMRNIRRAGFALADAGGAYDIQVELIAVDEAQAQALQNIVQGVVGLQALAEEEPEMAFLSSLQTQREGERVSLSVEVGSGELLNILD